MFGKWLTADMMTSNTLNSSFFSLFQILVMQLNANPFWRK